MRAPAALGAPEAWREATPMPCCASEMAADSAGETGAGRRLPGGDELRQLPADQLQPPQHRLGVSVDAAPAGRRVIMRVSSPTPMRLPWAGGRRPPGKTRHA